jgi:Ca2+-binding RTX toxin-like protein
MALTIVSADDTDGITFLEGTDITVLPGVTVSNALGNTLRATSGTYNSGQITILGTLVAGGEGINVFTNLDSNNSANGSTIYIGSTGQIFSGRNGIILEDGATASPIINYGEIFGHYRAIYLSHGTITTTGAFDIANHGTMSAYDLSTIYIGSYNSGSILNTGMMTNSDGNYVVGVDSAGALDLTNTGTISTSGAFAIFSSAAADIFNSGDIFGGISLGNDVDTIRNTGLIDGNVLLGYGDDVFDGRGGSVTGNLLGSIGNDTLHGGDAADLISGGDDDDVVGGNGGDDSLIGDAGLDTIMGGAGDDTIDGGNDNDRLFGGADNDVIIGGFGHDSLSGDLGNDSLLGDVGNDTLTGGNGNDTLDGGGGADLLYGNMGDDKLSGGVNAFSDTLHGGSGDDTLDGGAGVDFLFGDAGNDSLNGGTNNDELSGGWGADTLIGGGGLDTLNGGAGDDQLSGGANPDTFVFAPRDGNDTITDFTNGLDRMDVSAMGFTSFANLSSSAAISAFGTSSTLIDFENGHSILLEGFDVANLGASDFVF